MEKILIVGYILAGGKNSRMNGKKKIFLQCEGEMFYERILKSFDKLPCTYISVEDENPYVNLRMPMVVDLFDSIGPMGGICSGLKTIECDALLVAACDMPMISKEVVQELINMYQNAPKITVIRSGGKLHPLLGIYPKSVLAEAETLIANNCYKMMFLLEKSGYQVLELEEDSNVVNNINTPEEYQILTETYK